MSTLAPLFLVHTFGSLKKKSLLCTRFSEAAAWEV